MAANLDTTNGITPFADARTDAWHQLGQQVGHAMTAEEAMRLGMLGGWNLRKAPLWAEAANRLIPIPGRYAVLRDNPVVGRSDALGVVGHVEQQIPATAKARGISEAEVKTDVMLKFQPTKEFVGTDEVAAIAMFLASDAAKSINGTHISVDGGWTAQ